MKVNLQNLGRIREAEIDVRPLTVFVGPNSTNKSWAAYACFPAWPPDNVDAADMLAKDLATPELVTAQRCDALPVERQFLFSAPRIADVLADDLPLPAQNFIEWTSLARTRPTPPPGVGAPELARLLQHGVFKGRIESPIDGPMRFSTGEASVPVQAAASMVRSLAPLSMWLERIGSPGDTLVIDEPEMNAHPGAQLALAELFALMVNHGFRLILTTHSPYLVEHLSTLMEGYSRPPANKEKLAGSFLLQRADAFIDPEKVSVYEFREKPGAPEVEVVDILDREQALIDTTTFAAWTNRMGDLLDEVLSTEEGGS